MNRFSNAPKPILKKSVYKTNTMSRDGTERYNIKKAIHKKRQVRFSASRQVDDTDLGRAYHIISKTKNEQDLERSEIFSAMNELAESVNKPGLIATPNAKIHNKMQHMMLADAMYGNEHIWYDYIFQLLKKRAGDIRYKYDISSKMIFSRPMCVDDDDNDQHSCDDEDEDDASNNFSVLADGTKFALNKCPNKRFKDAMDEFKCVCHTISLCTSFLFSNEGHYRLQNGKTYGYPLSLPDAYLKEMNNDGSFPVGDSMTDRAWVGVD